MPIGDVTELPGLYPQGEEAVSTEDSAEIAVLDSALEADPGLESIEATAWPDPVGTRCDTSGGAGEFR